MQRFPLAEQLSAAAAETGSRIEPNAELEAALEQLIADARAAWPELGLDTTSFVRHLARHLPRDVSQLARVRAADLFLACACLHGEPQALSRFDQRFLARLPTYLAKIDRSPAFVDEVRQLLAEKLFVARSGQPKIADYSGGGSLEGWVRVAAIRTAQNLIRGPKPNVALSDDDVLALHDRAPAPELEYLRARYASVFSDALREALAARPAKEKNLLNLYFVDRLPSTAIGKLYGVHGATVRRWIEQTREALLADTRERVQASLKLDASELDSLMVVIQSQIDLTITSCLRGDAGSSID